VLPSCGCSMITVQARAAWAPRASIAAPAIVDLNFGKGARTGILFMVSSTLERCRKSCDHRARHHTIATDSLKDGFGQAESVGLLVAADRRGQVPAGSTFKPGRSPIWAAHKPMAAHEGTGRLPGYGCLDLLSSCRVLPVSISERWDLILYGGPTRVRVRR